MELSGTRTIDADRQTVWEHLNDPEVLKACVPGCEELTGSAEEGFQAVVKQKVGPVKATFKGQVRIEDANPPVSYKLVGEGKGGVAGFAKGSAIVTLQEVPEGTELVYDVESQVGGKLAQLGNRVVGGFAKKMAEEFFERFQAQVEGPSEPAEEG
ncbi:CoxG family protein [Histidinibacterium aquaticum]|uniref:Carbon monoxide dehydrogenase subunit G n=1 Tax=Histidinibacterium aquaticum TaxID=2613962 RepID=A0A5J5GPE4_9RHOB|nr:carbon monoxide dehydrogenase subunit G [Histidinibacterium aquaticum]KAA9009927.1 carbon monoxide dehydrogenase subunit G [Histidinibacterium aquaticum]